MPVGTRTEWDLVAVEQPLGKVADRSFAAGEDIAAAAHRNLAAQVPAPHTMREVRRHTHWGLVVGLRKQQVPLAQVMRKRELVVGLHKQELELVQHHMAPRLRKEQQERAHPMGLDCFVHWSAAQGRPSWN